MRTGLTKKQKTTVVYFDEYGGMIEVQTHNTDLKKRLTAFAAMYPQCCRQTDDDEQGGLTFEIEKGIDAKSSLALNLQKSNVKMHIEHCPDGCALVDGGKKLHALTRIAPVVDTNINTFFRKLGIA